MAVAATRKGRRMTPFVGLAEAAETLGITRQTAARMIQRGTIPRPAFYVGKSPRWPRAAWQRFLETGECPATSRPEPAGA